MEGIIINGIVINNLRYADDTILIAGSLRDLQTLLSAVVHVHHSEQMG